VLVFNLAGGPYTSVTVRPSGTEPKIKHYIAHHGPDEDRAAVDQQAAALQADVKRIEREILAAL
jgi:phosphomannomutase